MDKELQEIVLDAMEQEDCTPSYSQTVRMKKLYNSCLLDEDTIYSIAPLLGSVVSYQGGVLNG